MNEVYWVKLHWSLGATHIESNTVVFEKWYTIFKWEKISNAKSLSDNGEIKDDLGAF